MLDEAWRNRGCNGRSEEEQWDDDDIIAEYGTAIGEAKEEVGQKVSPLMILVRPFVTHKENAKVKRRRSSLSAC